MSSVVQSFVVDFAGDCKSYVHYTTSNPVSDYRRASSNFVPNDSGDIVSLFENVAKAKIREPCKEGVDTLVLDWYIRLLHPPESYLKHLDYFRSHDKDGNFTDYRAGGRVEGFYFYKHKCKKKTWVAVPDVVCDNYNPCSKFKSIRSSASRTYSQLKNLDGCQNLILLDLTFPKEISNRLLGSNQSSVIERVHSCVAKFTELLEGNLEAHVNENKSPGRRQSIPSSATLGYQYNVHLWRTQEPVSPHLHIHLDLLWSFLSGDKLHPLKFHDRGVPLAADFVRSLWRQSVSEIFDFDFGDKEADIYLKWAPLCWGKKILHRLKYRRRKPITDLGEYYLDHGFNPDSFDFGFNKFLLDYVNWSHSCGFWTFLVRLLKDSSDPKYSANVKICPVCGEKVISKVYIPFEEGVFDRVVIQDRHGFFRSVEPPP